MLDLGSGAGLDLVIAAEKVGQTGRVIGVDMTEAMLERAREATARLPQVEVLEGHIEHLPIEDRSVDWIISNCVINLSPDKQAVFREIVRVLRPGGRIAISDIVVEDLPDGVRQGAAAYLSCVAGAVGEAAYLDGLRAAGLEQVEVTERLVYDASQIRGLIESELGAVGCLSEGALGSVLEAVEGKVWSARFGGRKPARPGPLRASSCR